MTSETEEWVPPKTTEEQAVDKARKNILTETRRWLEEISGQSFANPSDFRGSLRNGIILCEALNKLKPGSIKRINRRSTPMAGLDNLSVFLAALQKDFGLSKSHLFDLKDLEDISEKFTGNAFAAEDESRALKVTVTLYWLAQQLATSLLAASSACSSEVASVRPVDPNLFTAGNVIHRRQSTAFSDTESLASSGYATSGHLPVRHSADSTGPTSADSLDEASRPTSSASLRFHKPDASDLAKAAEKQMEVARMNRNLAATAAKAESGVDDEWRSSLTSWRERRRQQNPSAYVSVPSVEEEAEEVSSDSLKPFRKIVEDNARRKRNFNLLYPLEDEDSAFTTAAADAQPAGPGDKTAPFSTSLPESAPWAAEPDEAPVIARSTSNQHTGRSAQRLSWGRPSNGTSPRGGSPSSSASSGPAACKARERAISVRLTRRQGHRVESRFGLQLGLVGRQVAVQKVVRGSTGDINDVRSGDLLASIDGAPVTSLAEANRLLDSASVQLGLRRSATEEDELEEFSEEEDTPVEMRSSIRPVPAFRRSAPAPSTTSEEDEQTSNRVDPNVELPPLRRSSSSSSSGPKISPRPAKNGALSEPHLPGGTEVDGKRLSGVRQRISNLESRNSFFGVKADSEESASSHEERQKHKEFEQRSFDSSSERVSAAASTLPWQRKCEFRPIKPRLVQNQLLQRQADEEEERRKEEEEERKRKREEEEERRRRMREEEEERRRKKEAERLLIIEEEERRMREEEERRRQRREEERRQREEEERRRREEEEVERRRREEEEEERRMQEEEQQRWRREEERRMRLEEERRREEEERRKLEEEQRRWRREEERRRRLEEEQEEERQREEEERRWMREEERRKEERRRREEEERRREEEERRRKEEEEVERRKPKTPPRTLPKPQKRFGDPDRGVGEVEALQLLVGMSEMRSDMARFREQQASNEAEIESVLSSSRSGGSASPQQRLSREMSTQETPADMVAPPVSVRQQVQHLEQLSHQTRQGDPPRYSQHTSSLSSTFSSDFLDARDPASRHSSVSPSKSKPDSLNKSDEWIDRRHASADSKSPGATSSERLHLGSSPPKHVSLRAVTGRTTLNEVKSRHSPRSKELLSAGDYEPPPRPKSLTTDRRALSSPEEAGVRPSTSDTQLVSSSLPKDSGLPSYQQYQLQQQQLQSDPPAKPSYARAQHHEMHYQPQNYHTVEQAAPRKPAYPSKQYDSQNHHVYQAPHIQHHSLQHSPKHTFTQYTQPMDAPSTAMTTSMYDFNRAPAHLAPTAFDDSALLQPSSRSQVSLSSRDPGPTPQQLPPRRSIPNSHSVDSGLVHHARPSGTAVSNPVYAGANLHEPKRAHGHSQRHEHEVGRGHAHANSHTSPSHGLTHNHNHNQPQAMSGQRYWLVEEALRRQKAEREGFRRLGPPAQDSVLAPQLVQPQHSQPLHMPLHSQAPRLPSPTVEPPPALPPRIKSSAEAALKQRTRPVLNSRAPCCACNHPLGTGDLMTIESLQLSFHLACFRCVACNTRLGNGRHDADVRVRGNRLYCFNCSAMEEGTVGPGGSLGRRRY